MRWLKYYIGKGLLLLALVAVCAIFAKPLVGCLVQVVLWWMEYWPQELNCYVFGWGCVVGLLKLYWTDEQIDRIEKTLETFLKRDEKDVLFLRCLKFVRCQTQVGGDFSSKAQMEYLHRSKDVCGVK